MSGFTGIRNLSLEQNNYKIRRSLFTLWYPRISLFQDIDLAASVAKSINVEGTLECFYVYEAPQLTFASFQLLIESFPGLQRFGNLTRWAVNCEGIQQVRKVLQ